jgi:hypothetical protein
MTPLTVKDRARTFPLDQLLAVKRRGARVCLICADCDTPACEITCLQCLLGTGPMLADPDDLIVMNHARRP